MTVPANIPTMLLGIGGAGAGASPVIESVSSYTGGRLTTRNMTLPAGIAAGDVILIVAGCETSASVMSFTTGSFANAHTESGSNPRLQVEWQIAVGGETSVTVTTTTSKKVSATMYRISGAKSPGSGGLDITVLTTTSTNPNPPANTPAAGSQKYVWIAAGCAWGSNKPTAAPSGYGNFLSVVTTAGLGDTAAWGATLEPGVPQTTENPGVFTSAIVQFHQLTMAIHPA